MHRRYLGVLAVTAGLIVSMMSPTLAAAPPAGWTAADIGAPEAAGSTDVDDKGVWTVNGGGHDIWDAEDDFHFVYQRVKGDASISARFLSLEAVNAQWTKAGLMLRENDTPGSPYGSLLQNSGMGVRPQARLVQDLPPAEQPGGSTANSTGAGPSPVPVEGYMRLQRSGNDVSYYLSQDGKIWTAFARPHTIPTLGEEALIGLAVTSHERDDRLAVARFDNVEVKAGASLVPGLQGCGGDKLVMLEWKALKGAESYNIYRAAAGETDATKFTLVNDKAVSGTSFTDNTAGLVNGTPVTYAVAAVVSGVEGERVLLPATPFVPTPAPGFAVTSLNETPDNANPDNLIACPAGKLGPFFDAGTGNITLRGSGGNIAGAADSGNFMLMEFEGNFQVTVKALTKPLRTNYNAKAGLVIREGVERGDRNAFLGLSANGGLFFQARDEIDGATFEPGDRVIPADELTAPMWLRLTRTGDEIKAEYSLDDGKTFVPAGDPNVVTIPDLASKVQVGLAIASDRTGTITEAKFSNLEVKK